MEIKGCERVLTTHTPPLKTVCFGLALASLINKGCVLTFSLEWQKQICILQRRRGFGYSLANRQVTKRQWTPLGSLWLSIAHLCSSSCCRI
uniref:Uncharacterized protein n=1 Tax=Glycine max TaxID=3847 RepID=C6T3U3_SOYBN|nr:unknown [Glycine max]